jgi:hypothetical protein
VRSFLEAPHGPLPEADAASPPAAAGWRALLIRSEAIWSEGCALAAAAGGDDGPGRRAPARQARAVRTMIRGLEGQAQALALAHSGEPSAGGTRPRK